MPVCDHCQTPYVKGQRYCKQCGSFLLAVEEEKPYCPECGTRVSPKQTFCHECDAPLKEEGQVIKPLKPETPPSLKEEPAESSGPLGLRKWVMALILGAALVLGFLLILFLTRPSDPPRPKSLGQVDQKTTLQPPAVQPSPAPSALETARPPQTSVGVIEDLPRQLEKVLETMREANIKKDIASYMSCFSYSFPELDKQRQKTLKTWEQIDFKRMVFTINDLKNQSNDDILGNVNWIIVAQDLGSKDAINENYTYQVWFVRELGQWKIKKIDEKK